jgi:hypothetical protein
MPPRFPENFWRDLLPRKVLEVSTSLHRLQQLTAVNCNYNMYSVCCQSCLTQCYNAGIRRLQHRCRRCACQQIRCAHVVTTVLTSLVCGLMQRTKWAIFVSVPIWFGYGFARNPDNLEWVKEVVSSCYSPKVAGSSNLGLQQPQQQLLLQQSVGEASSHRNSFRPAGKETAAITPPLVPLHSVASLQLLTAASHWQRYGELLLSYPELMYSTIPLVCVLLLLRCSSPPQRLTRRATAPRSCDKPAAFTS